MDDDLRLFSVGDVLAIRHPLADAALHVARTGPCLCLLCDEPVDGQVAYVAILTQVGEPPYSSGICDSCGQSASRPEIERRVLEMTVLHGYTAGHA